jgi:hypothetical protein
MLQQIITISLETYGNTEKGVKKDLYGVIKKKCNN